MPQVWRRSLLRVRGYSCFHQLSCSAKLRYGHWSDSCLHVFQGLWGGVLRRTCNCLPSINIFLYLTCEFTYILIILPLHNSKIKCNYITLTSLCIISSSPSTMQKVLFGNNILRKYILSYLTYNHVNREYTFTTYYFYPF